MSKQEKPELTSMREELVEHIRKELFGPVDGEEEQLLREDPPHKRYILGVLYPRETKDGGGAELENDEDMGITVSDADEPDDSPLAAMLQRAPASAGMTFATEANSAVCIKVSGARYELLQVDTTRSGKSVKRYTRIPLSPESVTFTDTGESNTRTAIFRELGELRLRWRKIGDLRVVTVSIVNTNMMESGSRISPEKCLFQIKMRITCKEGGFVEPPRPKVALDSEEEELRLRYRKHRAWAVGHATSVSWSQTTPDSTPDSIEMDFLPLTDVYDFNSGSHKEATFNQEILSPGVLSEIQDVTRLKVSLNGFIDSFALWLEKRSRVEVDSIHAGAFASIIEKLSLQESRLRLGVDVLCDETAPERLKAFQLANSAMLTQMQAMYLKNGKKFDADSIKWYPFQLAFQLLSIPGVIGDVPDSGRELVDLIWFPTGGGKTEAYLLLAAFTIILRRLRFGPAGGGTAVISRYTLRLLTAQQFERTATLICALEQMRRQQVIPGDDPITIGLWIGGGQNSSPNTLREAETHLEEILEEENPLNRFMLLSCPWCGKTLLPMRRSEERKDYGLKCTPTDFIFHCISDECPFHDRIPVQVVDEVIYSTPPTILLGTIDKFARLPWEHRSRGLLGLGSTKRPPDLIIQDELHLISGPLGTIAALYEAGIDVLIEHAGNRPKIIAATATIRGAEDQAKRLYGRKVCLFPASGPDAVDSYFMTEDHSEKDDQGRPPRQYIGIMGQGHTPVTNTVRVMAAMLDGGGVVSDGDDFWTLVAYHNSRRELGKTQTLARDDVPARIKLISSDKDNHRKCERVEELSGNVATNLVPLVLKAVEYSRESGEAVDVLACTNMISVGVDVSRLNLMLILGQPKTSAEYIQASSRVGRSKESAGLVAVNYSPTKPRDRSHYESFRRFHESFYRWVEPTSVTPGAGPAQERALHAVVIMVVRLALLPKSSDASKFDHESPETQNLLAKLTERLKNAVEVANGPGDEADAVEERVNEIINWWNEAKRDHSSLRFKREPQFDGLMEFFGNDHHPPARPTLNSMRSIDGEVGTFIRGAGRNQ
jgi:hypothetical protein